MGRLQRRSAPCLWRRRVQLCGGATWRVWGRNRKRTPHSCRKPEQEIWFCSFLLANWNQKTRKLLWMYIYIIIYIRMYVMCRVICHMTYVICICIHVHTPQTMRHFLWFPVSWFHVPFNYFWHIEVLNGCTWMGMYLRLHRRLSCATSSSGPQGSREHWPKFRKPRYWIFNS